MRLDNYCPNVRMKAIFMNTENSKPNEPRKCVLNMSLFKLFYLFLTCTFHLSIFLHMEKYKTTNSTKTIN